MSDVQDSMGASIWRSAKGLGLFALCTAGLIALTFQFTEERIQIEIAKAKSEALYDIIPKASHDNDLLNDTISLMADGKLKAVDNNAHIALQEGEPVGIIIPNIAPDGYSGNISLLVGLDMSGSVTGVRVIEHKETPGLGDKIELRKSDWIKQFDGRTLSNTNWAVKKDGGDFDQLTGATITPRAIVQSVKQTLEYYAEQQTQILEQSLVLIDNKGDRE